jgi:hypothetical protein
VNGPRTGIPLDAARLSVYQNAGQAEFSRRLIPEEDSYSWDTVQPQAWITLFVVLCALVGIVALAVS